jgi:hypothetical protein
VCGGALAGNKGGEDWKSKVVSQLLEDEKKKAAAKMGGKKNLKIIKKIQAKI